MPTPCKNSTAERLLIAAGDTLIGGIRAQNDVLVDGQLIGDITVATGMIRIMSRGRVTGRLNAPCVVIDGQLDGSCYTRQLTVSSGAIVRAQIKTTDFALEPGGVFIGAAEYDTSIPNSAQCIEPRTDTEPRAPLAAITAYPATNPPRSQRRTSLLVCSAALALTILALTCGYLWQDTAPDAPASAAQTPVRLNAPKPATPTPKALNAPKSAKPAKPALTPTFKPLDEGACLLELAQWQTRVLNASLETIQRTRDIQTKQNLNQVISRTATQLRDTRKLLQKYAPHITLAPYHFREGSPDAANSRAYRRLMQQYARQIETLSRQANNPSLHPASQRLVSSLRSNDVKSPSP